MKPPFSLHNAILEQVAKEDLKEWAKRGLNTPPPPPYEEVKIPFSKANIVAFIKNLRP